MKIELKLTSRFANSELYRPPLITSVKINKFEPTQLNIETPYDDNFILRSIVDDIDFDKEQPYYIRLRSRRARLNISLYPVTKKVDLVAYIPKKKIYTDEIENYVEAFLVKWCEDKDMILYINIRKTYTSYCFRRKEYDFRIKR